MAQNYARLCRIWDEARNRATEERSMSETIRLTAAQAMVKWLSVQMTEEGERFIEGVWAIFGHGNVAGIGEALHGIGDALPTWRGQNEQTMAHAAIAYAKTKRRRKAMAVTSSIGPGATNMVTAAALAHVNRLPVLLIPGDVFANRRPDPVLQQIEDFDDGTVSANDCFRPVARYYDRITRPEHLLTALPRALGVMTRSAERRAGRPRLLPGRPGGELRLSGGFLRAPHVAHPPARARSARGRRGGGHAREGLPAGYHFRRRGVVLRSRRRAGRLRRAP